MEEIWKEIPGFPGYEVSNLGQVRSYFYPAGGKWEIAENPQRILRSSRHPRGYRQIGLRQNGKTYRYLIGRLVLLAFVEPPPDGMEMCHNDGDPANDHLTNLRWDTKSANAQDMITHGRGRKPKLSQIEVYTIRIKFASGKHSPQEFAREFGVSRGTINDVLAGRNAYRDGLGPIWKGKWLDSRQAEAIRKQRAAGKSLANLAKEYGICISAISRIASGKTYSKAAGPRIQPYEIIVAPTRRSP